MDFTFSNDQLMFQEEVRKFLINEVTPEKIRELWKTETGRSTELWMQLAELGLTGITVPEEFGGLGLSVVDFILLAQACGYVALPEPLVHNVMVAAPFLLELDNEVLNKHWLTKMARGEAKIVVALDEQDFIEDLHIADLLILERNGTFYALDPSNLKMRANASVDPSRRLFAVDINADKLSTISKKIADGEKAKKLVDFVKYSGALGVAAEALGLTQRMLDLSINYTTQREQFGKAIGSFQAVKHLLANVAYKLEYAKAPVYRAAYALAHHQARAPLYVSHAKIAACEVADLAAKNAIQVHGAMGYTWEMSLHIFMKRAWVFQNAWSDMAFLKNRVADFVLTDDIQDFNAYTFD